MNGCPSWHLRNCHGVANCYSGSLFHGTPSCLLNATQYCRSEGVPFILLPSEEVSKERYYYVNSRLGLTLPGPAVSSSMAIALRLLDAVGAMEATDSFKLLCNETN